MSFFFFFLDNGLNFILVPVSAPASQIAFLKTTEISGTSLVVWWLRLRTPSAGGPGLIPVRESDPICGNKDCMLKLKSPCATSKTQCSLLRLKFKKKTRKFKFLCIDWINNNVLFYRAEEYIQYPMTGLH